MAKIRWKKGTTEIHTAVLMNWKKRLKYIVDYNEERAKEKLGWKSPVEYTPFALAAWKERNNH